MLSCSLKCSMLPCVHIQNSKNEVNIEDSKENSSPQSDKNDADINELNNTSNDNNNMCDKSSDDLNLNIDPVIRARQIN